MRVLPWIIVAVFAAALVLDVSEVQYLPAAHGQNASVTMGLIPVGIMVGFGYLFVRFARWHRGFHASMKQSRR